MTAPRTAVAITSLAQVEDKLRRALNLAGDVGLTFGPNMTPVVVATDATAIGNATYRGRRFVGCVTATYGATWSQWFKAADNVVITDIHVRNAAVAGAQIDVELTGPNVADPYTTTTPFAIWAERAASNTDLAPLLRNSTADASISIGVVIHRLINTTANQLHSIDWPVMLTPGAKLGLRSTSAAGITSISLSGYVF